LNDFSKRKQYKYLKNLYHLKFNEVKLKKLLFNIEIFTLATHRTVSIILKRKVLKFKTLYELRSLTEN